jgi:hypothetical protein
MIISEHVRGKAFANNDQKANGQDQLVVLQHSRSNQVVYTTHIVERHAMSIDDPIEFEGSEFDGAAAEARKRSASFPFVNNIPNFYRNEMVQQHFVAPNRKYFNLTTRVLESNALSEKFKRENPQVVRTIRKNRVPYENEPSVISNPAITPNNGSFQLKRVSERIVNSMNTSPQSKRSCLI